MALFIRDQPSLKLDNGQTVVGPCRNQTGGGEQVAVTSAGANVASENVFYRAVHGLIGEFG